MSSPSARSARKGDVTLNISAQRFPTEARTWLFIKNRDVLVSSIAAMVAGPIAAIANLPQLSLLFGGNEEDAGPLGWIGLIGTIK